MIGFLRGKIALKQPPLILIDVQGVGYELEAPMSSFYGLGEIGSDVKILTHMHVREDAMLLFGFVTEQERALFRELIKVSGIGAKMALAILSTHSVDEFCSHVHNADAQALTKIPGVGKKTAERLLIEVRDKLKNLTLNTVSTKSLNIPQPGLVANSILFSAQAAMQSLGYKDVHAESLVKTVYQEDMTLEQVIKAALQQVKI